MADSKISQLTSGAPAQAGDEYVIARSGSNFKLTLTNIAASMPPIGATTPNTGAFTSLTNGLGAVGTPSYTFTGDLNTGMWSPTADTVAWSTGGSERMRIDSSGNVGIGGTAEAYAKVGVTGTLPSSSNVSISYRTVATIPSGSTSSYSAFSYFNFTEAASFTLTDFFGFNSAGVSVGAGSAVTNNYAFYANAGNTFATNNYGFWSGIASGSNRWNFYAAGTARNYFAGGVEDSYGNLRKIPQSGSDKTTSYTLATTDVGQFIGVGSGGSVTIPDATFATGDVVSIFNNTSGNVTITCTITTAYIAGTDADKATVTLATRGVATILFISGTVCVISGNVS